VTLAFLMPSLGGRRSLEGREVRCGCQSDGVQSFLKTNLARFDGIVQTAIHAE
jgi:hypothetical protein